MQTLPSQAVPSNQISSNVSSGKKKYASGISAYLHSNSNRDFRPPLHMKSKVMDGRANFFSVCKITVMIMIQAFYITVFTYSLIS